MSLNWIKGRMGKKRASRRVVAFMILLTASVSSAQAQSGLPREPALTNARITSTGELEVVPSKTSSAKDFDFLVGQWDLHNKKFKTRLNHSSEWTEFESTVEMRPILHGLGNIDTYKETVNGRFLEGIAIRLFNPKTRLWSIHWADSNAGAMDPPVVGSFEGNIGRFYAKDVFQGKPILVMFEWG